MVAIGHLGSGKSSLLATIMKECQIKAGQIGMHGTVAYVEQEPFILSDTIKENITLGKEVDDIVLH